VGFLPVKKSAVDPADPRRRFGPWAGWLSGFGGSKPEPGRLRVPVDNNDPPQTPYIETLAKMVQVGTPGTAVLSPGCGVW
jgi:hypothetical protein